MSEGSLVARLQQEVADRQPVDWDALMAQLGATHSASPAVLREVSLLRLLDEIGQAHSAFQSGALDDGEDSPTTDVEAPSLDDTLESWGRYLLDAKVGRGGFGAVYRAWDPSLEMPVAIKILHRRFEDDRLKQRLLHEGRALAQVTHPNVVRVLNVEQHDGRLGLVMEFLSGEPLDAIVAARGMMNEREAAIIVEDVCRALVAVHANGLIHRDVKARNIIRQPAGRIVLMDFGAGLAAKDRQEAGVALGTPLYMSPETLGGQPASIASDVYSVGVLLFYLVTGRHPYEGRTVDDIRDAHARGQPLALLGLRPELPLPFVKIVDKALAVVPEQRFQTPAAMLAALLELRYAPADWRRRVAIGALAVAGGVGILMIGGMLASGAFNLSMGRNSHATESFPQWLALGRRSLLMPVVLCLLGALLVGVSLAVRRVLTPASSRLRKLDEAVSRRCGEMATRFSLSDPGVCSSWLVLLTGLGAAAVWIYWWPLLQVITLDISRASAGALEILSPPFEPYRTHYRMALTLLAAANVTGWYAIRRFMRGRGLRLPGWVIAMECAVLVLLYTSMQVPYRILNDHNKFDSVSWKDEECFLLGERAQDALLFCPTMMPRNHIVPRGEFRVVAPATRERSFFAAFTPKGQ